MTETHLRLATRGSALALWQSEHVRSLLLAVWPDLQIDIVKIVSQGDADRERPLSALGGVGVFTREIQQAVIDGRADFAVHSLKDLPTDPHPQLVLAATPKRGLPFDALISPKHKTLDALPHAARVATGSPRRRAQLLRQRPDLQIEDIRGNVDTRLRKLDEKDLDAMVLAQAGLTRLGFESRVTQILSPPIMLPAPSQGAIGIECRSDAQLTRELLKQIEDRNTRIAVDAERSLLHTLRAGCQVPVGAKATVNADTLHLSAIVLSPDGREAIENERTGDTTKASTLGVDLAKDLIDRGAQKLLARCAL